MDANFLSSNEFWQSPESHLFVNPRLNTKDFEIFQNLFAHRPRDLKAHLYIASSGTRSTHKVIAIGKKQILKAAQSVNQYLQISAKDSWLLALPTFHISGLSICARAYLSQSQIIELKGAWDAKLFHDLLYEKSTSLSSLVPTQIYDLVQQKLSAPPTLRYLFVGGALVDPDLEAQARRLHWPLQKVYGMTESAAFFAICQQSAYKALSHFNWRINKNSEIEIKGDSLFSGQLVFKDSQVVFEEPFDLDGYWNSKDLATSRGSDQFQILGRNSDFIKVLGEKVSLVELEKKLNLFFDQESPRSRCYVLAKDDERRGNRIVAWIVKNDLLENEIGKALQSFNKSVNAFERIQAFLILNESPQLTNGKLSLSEKARIESRNFYKTV